MSVPHVVVIGGGISGLTAAYRLHTCTTPVRVTLLEAAPRLGGKISTTPFGGRMVDEGPDAFLARVPWGTDLCRELGIDDRLISPSSSGAYVVSRGKMRRLPEGLMLGVPSRLRQIATSGIISPLGMARAGLDLVLPDNWNGRDESVGDLISRRLGREVAERLVDPLIGSINASDTFKLSAEMSAPQIADTARRHRSLIRGVRELQRQREATPDAPLFHSFNDGVGVLVDRLAKSLDDDVVKTSTAATSIEQTDEGYRVGVGTGHLDADAVVIATPARHTAGLVRPLAPAAADTLDAIEYASVAMVTMSFRAGDVGHPLDGSGLLVPEPEGKLVTAVSFANRKWPHWTDDERVLLRVSAGRHGDDRWLQLDDDELVNTLANEVGELLDISGPVLEWRVTRWVDSFPQYRPGHGQALTAAEADLAARAPGIELCGASYRGVGIPACIRQGDEAARRVLDRLTS